MPLSYGASFNTTVKKAPLFYPPAIPGLQMWFSSRYPNSLISDGAASFASASSQYLSITNAASNSTLQTGDTEWWFAGWFYPTQNTNVSNVYSKYSHTANADLIVTQINAVNGSKVRVRVQTSPNTITQGDSSGSYTLNVWNFFICRNSPINKKIYLSLNGSAWDEISYTTTVITGTADATLAASAYDGRLDSFAFGKASSGLDAAADTLRDYLYNSGSGRVYAALSAQQKTDWGLVSWWDLNEATGTRYDRHGTNNLTASASSPTVAAGIAAGTASSTGAVISQWSDISGKNRHYTQSTVASKPTLQVASLNSYPGIYHDGVDDYLTSGFDYDFSTYRTMHMFLVSSPTSSSTILSAQRSGSHDYQSGFNVIGNGVNARLEIGFGDATGYSIYYTIGSDLYKANILTCSFSPSLFNLRFGGKSALYDTYGSLRYSGTMLVNEFLSKGSSKHRIGLAARTMASGYNYFGQLTAYELLVYSRPLTLSQIQYIERGLGRAWNLQVM